jgi:hypothetical protein
LVPVGVEFVSQFQRNRLAIALRQFRRFRRDP